MKIFKFLLFFLLLSLHAKADYNGFHFTFEINTKDGKTLKAYSYVAEYYWNNDSLNNQQYLLRSLGYQAGISDDTFHFFNDRLTYNYQNPEDITGERFQVYQLIDQTKLHKREIREIKVINQIEFTYTLNIYNLLSAKDLKWIQKEPKKRVRFGVYLCDFLICVHEENKKVNTILHTLSMLEEKYKSEEDNGDALEKYQEEFEEILKTLEGEKVVIVAGCSC
jgi:hypothetical protein